MQPKKKKHRVWEIGKWLKYILHRINSHGIILRNFQPGMKIYLYLQPWKEEIWDSQNNLTSKKSNIWECWDTLRDVVPVNSWKSDQGSSEYQIFSSTRMNAHTYMNLNTHECQYTHVSFIHTHMKIWKQQKLGYFIILPLSYAYTNGRI